MQLFHKLLYLIAGLLLCMSLNAQNEGNEVFVPVSKYLAQGNADNLSAWFADNLEIGIITPISSSSKNQAKQIVKSFFDKHTPRSFEINHIAGQNNRKYALGTLNAGGENFNVLIFMTLKNGEYKIQQLKIEKDQ